jgi:hypothetical protein
MSSIENQLFAVKEELQQVTEDLARATRDRAESEPLIADRAAENAVSGMQELFVHEDHSPRLPGNIETPDDWASLPFARFAMLQDHGDSSVGIPARRYWALAEDQTGTAFERIASQMLSMHATLLKAGELLREVAAGKADTTAAGRLATTIDELTQGHPLEIHADLHLTQPQY